MMKIRFSVNAPAFGGPAFSARPQRQCPRLPSFISSSRSRTVTRADVQQDTAALAKQLLQAEQEMQAMFQPGKPMPKAAMVAAKRGEVARLRAQLDGRMSKLEQEEEDPEEVEKARQAFNELEQYLQGNLVGNDTDEELLRLETENAHLRIRAHQLLLRQQQLEELALQHNIPIPGGHA